MTDMREKVRRGAVWLDENIDDWWNKVDLDRHNQSMGATCVLGQLHGGSWGRATQATGLTVTEMQDLGFDSFNAAETRESNEYWRLEIMMRRLQDNMPEPEPQTVTLTRASLERMIELLDSDIVEEATLNIDGVRVHLTQ